MTKKRISRQTKMLLRVMHLKMQGITDPHEIRRIMGESNCTWDAAEASLEELQRTFGVGDDYEIPWQSRVTRSQKR